jgi:hypothetical protein
MGRSSRLALKLATSVPTPPATVGAKRESSVKISA